MSSTYCLARSYRGNFPCVCGDTNCLQKNNREHIRALLCTKISSAVRLPVSNFRPYLTDPLCELIAEYIEDYAECTERSAVGSNSTMIAFVNQAYLYGNVKRKEKRKKDEQKDEKKDEEKAEKKKQRRAPAAAAAAVASGDDMPAVDENEMQTEDSSTASAASSASAAAASSAAASIALSASSSTSSPSSPSTASLSASTSGAPGGASASSASSSSSRAPPLPQGSASKAEAWDGSVDIFWLNYHGERVHYLRLPAAGQFIQQTYATHPWLAMRSSDGQHMLINGQYIFYPPRSNISREEEPCVAVITPVPPTLEGQWKKKRSGCDISCACKLHREREKDEMEVSRITNVSFKQEPMPTTTATTSTSISTSSSASSVSSSSSSSIGSVSSSIAPLGDSHGAKSKKRHGGDADGNDKTSRDGYDSDVD